MRRIPHFLINLSLIALAYLVLARLGLFFALPPEKKATAIWPPSGLALAALWRWGTGVWPGVWLGAWLANFWDYLAGGNSSPAWLNALVSAGIASGSSLQAVLAARGLKRLNPRVVLEDGAQTLRFLLVTMGACLVAASLGTLSLNLAGFAPWSMSPRIWETWWLGDWVGMVVFGSFLISYPQSGPPRQPGSVSRLEAPLIGLLLLAALVGFGAGGSSPMHSPLAYLILPVMILATFRFGLRGATGSLVLVSILATGGTAAGRGPFVADNLYLSLALMQVYLAAVGSTILLLAAVLQENARAQAALTAHSLSLADDVSRRSLQLQESESRFRAIFHSQFQFIGLMEPSGILLEANRTALQSAGVPEVEVLGKYFWDTPWWTHDPAQQQRLRQAVQQAAAGVKDRFEASHPTATGQLIWVDFSLTPFQDSAGRVLYLIPEGRDITDIKRVAEDLLIQEQHVREAFRHAPIGKAIVSTEGKWLTVNPALCELLGYPEAELLQLDFQTITHPDDLDADLDNVRRLLDGEISSYQMEKRYLHKDGHLIHVLLAVALVRDPQNAPLYFIAQILDISRRKQDQARLQSALLEKELMLKEIHHRVKNNLQLVSTMLDLQASYQDDPQVRAIFQEGRARLRSMALIHERLYRSENLDQVDFESYMNGLIVYLFQTYQFEQTEIKIHTQVAWQSLPLDQAVPCGLLLNELISNCLKHAFPQTTPESQICISLGYDQDGARQLTVGDNGRGLPAGFDPAQSDSFGMQLIFTLAEQLNGQTSLKSGPGFEFVLTFSVDDE